MTAAHPKRFSLVLSVAAWISPEARDTEAGRRHCCGWPPGASDLLVFRFVLQALNTASGTDSGFDVPGAIVRCVSTSSLGDDYGNVCR